MKFSRLTVTDLEPQETDLRIQKAANPANPANPIDSYGKQVANRLLISANDLLIPSNKPPPVPAISSGLANFSKRLATEIPEKSNTLAGLANLAASEGGENIQGALSRPAKTDQATQAKALAILRNLHAKHVANLKAGGHDGKGALVRRGDYWKALRKARLDPDATFDLLDQGRVTAQADGLYWVPQNEAST